jgi:hypothetical protein
MARHCFEADIGPASHLAEWLGVLRAEHRDRIPPVTDEVALEWRHLAALRPRGDDGGLIAATARVNGLILSPEMFAILRMPDSFSGTLGLFQSRTGGKSWRSIAQSNLSFVGSSQQRLGSEISPLFVLLRQINARPAEAPDTVPVANQV